MKRLLPLLLLILFLSAWSFDDCVEVDFDHPDCDQYVTTTTAQVTTTTVEVTTTTVTQPEVTTTEPPPVETTTTTVAQCPPGMIHQPPLCVPPTTDTTSDIKVSSTEVTRPPELPETGPFDVAMVLLAIASLSFLGYVAVRSGKE